MGRLLVSVVEDSFGQKKTYLCKLFILIGVDSFLYLVSDQENKLLLTKSYTLNNDALAGRLPGEQIFQIFEQDSLLKLPYANVKVAFHNPKQSFVPNRLYNPDKKATYLTHVAEIKRSNEIYTDDLSLLKAQNIYVVDRATYNFVAQMFSNVQLYHLSSALFLGFRQKAHYEKVSFYTNVRDGFLSIFLFKGKDLLFCNAFHFHSAKDFVYFIMMVFEQFNLNPKAQAINIAGDFEEGGTEHYLLNQYVNFIQPISIDNRYQMSDKFKSQIVPYQYFDVVSIGLCE